MELVEVKLRGLRSLSPFSETKLTSRKCSRSPENGLMATLYFLKELLRHDTSVVWHRKNLFLDVVVDIQIVSSGMVPGIVVSHPVDHQFTKILRMAVPQTNSPVQSRF